MFSLSSILELIVNIMSPPLVAAVAQVHFFAIHL